MPSDNKTAIALGSTGGIILLIAGIVVAIFIYRYVKNNKQMEAEARAKNEFWQQQLLFAYDN